ncbi:MAG: hypothetical protein E6J00_00400 [Chloroflexi bacterium]|nr:MAG: hypothetical protein E6J00_00400 [Chloroflexota bacterium]
MSFSVPLLALYLMSAAVLAVGLLAASTARLPAFLSGSALPADRSRVRLSGLELVLLGLLMLLTSFAYGGDGQSIRVVLLLFTWVGFAITMLVLRLLSRRLDKQRARP